MLEDEADMSRDRIVAQDRVTGLDQIANAEQEQSAEELPSGKAESGKRFGIERRDRLRAQEFPEARWSEGCSAA